MCTEESYDCVSSINIDNFVCLPQCSGLIVTSYDQHEIEDRLSNVVNKMLQHIYDLKKHKNEYQGFNAILGFRHISFKF